MKILHSVGDQLAVALERAHLRGHLETLAEERTAALKAEIVKRKGTEKRLRESEERYRLMFDKNPHPTWVYDAETLAFLAVNEAAIHHYGYSRGEFLGMTIKDIRPAEEVPALLRVLSENPHTPLTRVSVNVKHRKKDGTVIDVESASSAITFSGRAAALVLAMDVTERLRLEGERHRMEGQLEQGRRVESLGRVAATIAHEFNNVLMGIQPFAEVINRNTSADAKIRKAAGQIIHSVARGKRVTEDILRFTRASEPVLRPVDLGEWIEQLVPELRGMIGDRIEIRVDIPERPVVARCDPAQLQQVVANLAVNARDAIPGSGTIFITIASGRDDTRFRSGTFPPGMVLLALRDTGSGMPREILDHIFEPLFTTKRTGTGLGLAVAQRVIARHGGMIDVESEPGKGTTVSILLPAATLESPKAAPAAMVRHPRRVLLVEDEPEVAAGIAALLESDGMEVRSVACGRDAAPAARSFEPDAVILDVALPDMSGIDVFAELRLSWPKLPVLFSSGHGDQAA
ncbi:MAG TPA: ATP-binding protein, partial [Thermoanaerobaculia bacterium]